MNECLEMTTDELVERLTSLDRSIYGSEQMGSRDWYEQANRRTVWHQERAQIMAELFRRGHRLPGHPEPGNSLRASILNAREWITRRGFAWDHEVLHLLEELASYRRAFHRAELDGDDLRREWVAYAVDAKACGEWSEPFLAGLRRGFELRAEEKKSS